MGWWRRLRLSGTARAAKSGDAAAVDKLWWTWFFHPDPWLYRLLMKLGVPQTEKQWQGFGKGMGRVVLGQGSDTEPDIRAALLEALAFYNEPLKEWLGDHPMKRIARARVLAGGDRELMYEAAMRDTTVARHCLDRGLEPADPAQRAAFYLLVGEYGRFAELDPGGTCLAAAYPHLDVRLRVRVNQALLDSGHLAILAPERVPSVQALEIVEALAAREEWPHLHRMVDALPLGDAVQAAAVPESAGQGGGPLFDLLAGQDRTLLEGARGTFWGYAHSGPLRSPGYDEQSTRFTYLGALSPDGRRLIAWCEDLYRPRGGPRHLVIYALPEGEVSDTIGVSPPFHRERSRMGGELLLDTGEAVFFQDREQGPLYRLDGHRWEKLHPSSGPIVRHRAGFLIGESAVLRVHDAYGDVVANHTLPAGADWTPLAGDPISGRVVLYGASGQSGHLMIADPDGVPIARSPEIPSRVVSAVFRDPDQVIGAGEDGLRVWRVEGHRLRQELHQRMVFPGPLIMLRPRDELVMGGQIVDAAALPLDAVRLAEVGRPGPAAPGWYSDSGLKLAQLLNDRDDDEIAVRNRHSDAVMETAKRPLTAMTPDDLAVVRRELRSTPAYAGTRPFLDLLHAAISIRLASGKQSRP
ncbi:hypothetical protein [Spirillospora sp. NPDC048819]|uniref:hypothetical protein n=1 Tax=Spirillospora sp. NPDC048819 TaxID=3155268 RepID=UPI003411BD6C